MQLRALLALLVSVSSASFASAQQPPEPGLLFSLSGDRGLAADRAAGGDPAPNFSTGVKVLPGGAKGPYLQCADGQLLSYWAAGNVYAQRGTLAFFWRSRDPVDATEFPIFRIGYADHSSWDMVWLRIDYNGHGFDAFVTDVNLGRTRVSYRLDDFPTPDRWTHLAVSWDETIGLRLYVNGKQVAAAKPTGMFDAGLDQFGPNQRLVAPTGVESTYNFSRGGDLDELRIYDRMLGDDNVAALARGDAPGDVPPDARSVASSAWQEAWRFRYGWNRPDDLPPLLDAPSTVFRKVEIHDVYDLKRWWWRGTDGIRETTWPGVYNRSRLPGRNDYFQLPDWDAYSLSGKTVTFTLPDEPWNYVTIAGGAWGEMRWLAGSAPSQASSSALFQRAKGQEKTVHRLAEPLTGGRMQFTNVEQETPIGELAVYHVHEGREPAGVAQLRYRITRRVVAADNPLLRGLVQFITGRHPADERQTMVAMPAGGGSPQLARQAIADAPAVAANASVLPLVHVLIPANYRGLKTETRGRGYGWQNMDGGLDGIAIDLPALRTAPIADGVIAMNVQVKDPLWPLRTMLDVSFTVRPGEPRTVWLDTRDRILPNDRSLYITIASASADFGAEALEGLEVRLVFKPRKDATAEHVIDRLTQVRDNYANMVEEAVSSERLNAYNRFHADITDLLRVDPQNDLGRKYWYDANKEQAKPPFTLPPTPAGVPAWAHLQVTDLSYFDRFAHWYIDNRQIENGEFGGGLSDDSDLTDLFPGLAAMGVPRDPIAASVAKELEATFAQGLWLNGLNAGQYDELHSYEDGINVLGQSMLMNPGSPKLIERAMVTAKRLGWLTGVNAAGHRHVRSNYYSGAKMAEGGVWGRSAARSYHIFQPALLLVQFNGSPQIRKMVLEAADGLLAHRKQASNGRMQTTPNIEFRTDRELPGFGEAPWYMFWAAYRWTGDQKYLQPLLDGGADGIGAINSNALDMLKLRDRFGADLAAAGTNEAADSTARHLAWQVTGDTTPLERMHAARLEAQAAREYINTEGSLWIDRVGDGGGPPFSHGELQRARLGGILLQRTRVYPGNVVSWQFDAPAKASSVAILIPDATPESFTVTAHNMESYPVIAHMTGAEVEPGTWQMTHDGSSPSPAPQRESQDVTGSSPAPPRGSQDVTGSRSASLPTGRPIGADISAADTRPFERTSDWTLTLPPQTTTTFRFRLVTRGVPYWSRPDLGIDPGDVQVEGRRMRVTVHSVGAVDAPASQVVVRDTSGTVIARTSVPALKAPVDLLPKAATVTLTLPARADIAGGSVTIETRGKAAEITLRNNIVRF